MTFFENPNNADELDLLRLMCNKRKRLVSGASAKSNQYVYAFTPVGAADAILIVRAGTFADRLGALRSIAVKHAKAHGGTGSAVSIGQVIWDGSSLRLHPDEAASKGNVQPGQLRKGLKGIAERLKGPFLALKSARFAGDDEADPDAEITEAEAKNLTLDDGKFAALSEAGLAAMEEAAEQVERRIDTRMGELTGQLRDASAGTPLQPFLLGPTAATEPVVAELEDQAALLMSAATRGPGALLDLLREYGVTVSLMEHHRRAKTPGVDHTLAQLAPLIDVAQRAQIGGAMALLTSLGAGPNEANEATVHYAVWFGEAVVMMLEGSGEQAPKDLVDRLSEARTHLEALHSGAGTLTPRDLTMALGSENRHHELGYLRMNAQGADTLKDAHTARLRNSLRAMLKSEHGFTDTEVAAVSDAALDRMVEAALALNDGRLKRLYREELGSGLVLGTRQEIEESGRWEHKHELPMDGMGPSPAAGMHGEHTLDWSARGRDNYDDPAFGGTGWDSKMRDLANRQVNMELLAHEIRAQEDQRLRGEEPKGLLILSTKPTPAGSQEPKTLKDVDRRYDDNGVKIDNDDPNRIRSDRYTRLEVDLLQNRHGWVFRDGWMFPPDKATVLKNRKRDLQALGYIDRESTRAPSPTVAPGKALSEAEREARLKQEKEFPVIPENTPAIGRQQVKRSMGDLDETSRMARFWTIVSQWRSLTQQHIEERGLNTGP